MKLYIDTDTNTFIENTLFNSPVSEVSFKRGDSASVEVIFVSNNNALSATNDKLLTFGIKEAGKYDADFIVSTSDYNALGTSYVLNPSFNTVEINDLLNSGDGNEDNDIASISGMLEVTWSGDAGANWASSNIITAVINNDVIKGGEATPEPSLTLVQWLSAYHPSPLVLSAAPLNDVTGISQIETLSIPSNRIATGTLNVAKTGYSGAISITSAADNTLMAGKIYDALILNGNFSDYTISQALSVVSLVKTVPAANDAALSLNWISGFDPAVASVDVVSGQAESIGTPGIIGQDAIVNSLSCYKCTRTTPVKWVLL